MIKNRFSQYNAQEVSLISFRDLTTATIAVLVGVIVMLAMLVNPDTKKTDAENEQFVGNLRFEIVWPNEINTDLDLWCMAPGDVPVGYSNKGGKILNLVRDDLGSLDDVTGMNYEVIFSRGNPPGEYICNVHWYGNSVGVKEVPVKMIATYRRSFADSEYPTILTANTTMLHQGDEVTMIRFRLDNERRLVKSSVNSVQFNLRSLKVEK